MPTCCTKSPYCDPSTDLMDPLLYGLLHHEPVDAGGLALADPVHPPDGLQLLGRVEEGLHLKQGGE